MATDEGRAGAGNILHQVLRFLKMSKGIEKLAFHLQRLLALNAYFLFFLVMPSGKWAAGPDEISGLTDRASRHTPGLVKVLLSSGPFNWSQDRNFLARGLRSRVAKFAAGPLMLAYIARKFQGVLYFGKAGYLISSSDQRDWEFGFLAKRGVKVSAFLTGGDIRSPELSFVAVTKHIPEAISEYLPLVIPDFDSARVEAEQKRVAQVIDRHATAIVNAPLDQASYLQRETEDFMYFADINSFQQFPPLDQGGWRIAHIPSRPILKGTQVIRAALRELERQGVRFQYLEVHGEESSSVRTAIASSHIVVNELYSLLPGMLGIETLEMGRVLVTSAPIGVEACTRSAIGTRPWIEAHSLNLADKLAVLLQGDWESMNQQAIAGWTWVVENHGGPKSGLALAHILKRGTSIL